MDTTTTTPLDTAITTLEKYFAPHPSDKWLDEWHTAQIEKAREAWERIKKELGK